MGGAAVAQGLGEPRGHANTGPLDDPLELTQPRCARTIPELGGGLQTHHFRCDCPLAAALWAADNKTAIASLTAPSPAATHARARLNS